MGYEFFQRACIGAPDRSQRFGVEGLKTRTICETLVMLFEISLGTLAPGTDGHGKVFIRIA